MAIKFQQVKIVSAIFMFIGGVVMMVGCDRSAGGNNSQQQSAVTHTPAQAKAAKHTATIYSYDNPKVKPAETIGAFPPNDPRYMTIALQSQPGAKSGSVTRFPDPGKGVQAKVLQQQEWLGNIWYEVEAQGHIGWIAEHLIILESK